MLSALVRALTVLSVVLEELLVEDGACDFSSVVSALCAELMSLSESAVLTLERNFPSGLPESAFEGESDCTWARYFSALLVSPDLMADSRLLSAVSKLLLLLEELLVEDELESEVSREILLCRVEMFIECRPEGEVSGRAARRQNAGATSIHQQLEGKSEKNCLTSRHLTKNGKRGFKSFANGKLEDSNQGRVSRFSAFPALCGESEGLRGGTEGLRTEGLRDEGLRD